MRIVEIKATEKIEECWELLLAHREELTTHKHIMVLKPDIARYKMLEDAGRLLTLALYDGEKIVGYSVNLLNNNLHYSDLCVMQNDILYIDQKYRRGTWGMKLIRETERIALVRGAKMVLFHGKENTTFSELMPRLGYGVQDIMFSKEL